MSRVYEALVVLALLGILAAILIQVGLAIFHDKSSLLIPCTWNRVFQVNVCVSLSIQGTAGLRSLNFSILAFRH